MVLRFGAQHFDFNGAFAASTLKPSGEDFRGRRDFHDYEVRNSLRQFWDCCARSIGDNVPALLKMLSELLIGKA